MESSGGSGGWELQGLNAMVLPVGTVAEESTGEEHGLKAGGWVHGWDKGDSRGIPESIRIYRDCVVLETGETSGEQRGMTWSKMKTV